MIALIVSILLFISIWLYQGGITGAAIATLMMIAGVLVIAICIAAVDGVAHLVRLAWRRYRGNAAVLLALALLISPAHAQTRHDADSQWIRQTIHEKRRADWFAERRRIYGDRYRHYRRDRHRQAYHGPRKPRDDGTRVYGYVSTGPQQVQRDLLSNVECFPPFESISVEANTEDGAWKDAQRNWENAVRWKYGERFMSVANARDVVKQCSRSSGNQSVAGRIAENVATAMGQDGYKHRCQIRARACMAPIEISPETKEKQE